MAIQKSRDDCVRLTHRRGAGFMHQALGLDFRASATLVVLRGIAEAAMGAWPEDFMIDEIAVAERKGA